MSDVTEVDDVLVGPDQMAQGVQVKNHPCRCGHGIRLVEDGHRVQARDGEYLDEVLDVTEVRADGGQKVADAAHGQELQQHQHGDQEVAPGQGPVGNQNEQHQYGEEHDLGEEGGKHPFGREHVDREDHLLHDVGVDDDRDARLRHRVLKGYPWDQAREQVGAVVHRHSDRAGDPGAEDEPKHEHVHEDEDERVPKTPEEPKELAGVAVADLSPGHLQRQGPVLRDQEQQLTECLEVIPGIYGRKHLVSVKLSNVRLTASKESVKSEAMICPRQGVLYY